MTIQTNAKLISLENGFKMVFKNKQEFISNLNESKYQFIARMIYEVNSSLSYKEIKK